jgi:hypothetical protein
MLNAPSMCSEIWIKFLPPICMGTQRNTTRRTRPNPHVLAKRKGTVWWLAPERSVLPKIHKTGFGSKAIDPTFSNVWLAISEIDRHCMFACNVASPKRSHWHLDQTQNVLFCQGIFCQYWENRSHVCS